MKIIAKILLLTVILTSCLYFFGCANLFEPKWRAANSSFYVTVNEQKGADGLDFQIGRSYSLEITPLKGDVDENSHEQISIEFNNENAVIAKPYDFNGQKSLRYIIYFYELGQDDTLKITYNGETVEVKYDVIDYDFEASGWITPTSIEDLDPYAEFKEMLLSIKRHEFEGPYKGLDSYSYSTYWDEGYWYYNLRHKNDTGYLEYLTDSVYYPSAFDLVEQNPIGDREAYMGFRGVDKVVAGAERSVMDEFSVSYSVIDPCCTNPEYPLQSMGFIAENKELHKYTMNGKITEYPTSISILLEKYPEQFFVYDLNGLKIYICIRGEGNPCAYFTDDNYFYSLYAGYVYE